MEAMRRGAQVVAIDLSPTLVQLARERSVHEFQNGPGSIEFLAGDMLDPNMGHFDYVVAMDSLIHYDTHDIVQAIYGLTLRTRKAIIFTFAPRTALLAALHRVGRMFPRSDRSPALEPVAQVALERELTRRLTHPVWNPQRSQRIAHGFYTSQAWEWSR